MNISVENLSAMVLVLQGVLDMMNRFDGALHRRYVFWLLKRTR